MEPYSTPYTHRLAAAYLVTTAHEVFAWTETNQIAPDVEWPVDAYQNSGDPDEHRFIVAVPTQGGLVGFFAPSAEDAERIRQSIF